MPNTIETKHAVLVERVDNMETKVDEIYKVLVENGFVKMVREHEGFVSGRKRIESYVIFTLIGLSVSGFVAGCWWLIQHAMSI